jgi:sugar diacid utilization regulator
VRIQKDGKLKAEEEKRLLSLFHKGVEHIGISRPCENIMNLKEVYRQCIKLYRIRERLRVEDEIMYFEKYSFYVMISEMKERELFQFSHPALRTLREHDQAHNSELYETLCVFTRCRGHMIKAAEILSIHRISRILDLTGLDLQDDEEIFRLICGFKLEQYLRVSGSV